jgi:acid phosphatase (class A)
MLQRLVVAFALVVGGCAAQPTLVPPTQVAESSPGYVPGYLKPDELPETVKLLPPPPAAGTALLAADEEAYRALTPLVGTPRWDLAASDADLRFPHATRFFSCALDIPISAEATPHLNMLLRRVRADASRANDKTKDRYKRPRPFMVTNEAMCVPAERTRYKPDSYPSGHASIGWAWALVLSEIAPDRSNAVLARGYAFGNSRAVCRVHWKSDLDAGRIVGAATVSRLHANELFLAQRDLARAEIAAARAAGLHSPLDCAAERAALSP